MFERSFQVRPPVGLWGPLQQTEGLGCKVYPAGSLPSVAESAGCIVIYSIGEFRFFKGSKVLNGFNKVIVVDVWMLFG